MGWGGKTRGMSIVVGDNSLRGSKVGTIRTMKYASAAAISESVQTTRTANLTFISPLSMWKILLATKLRSATQTPRSFRNSPLMKTVRSLRPLNLRLTRRADVVRLVTGFSCPRVPSIPCPAPTRSTSPSSSSAVPSMVGTLLLETIYFPVSLFLRPG